MKTITVESRQQTVEVEFVLHAEDLARVDRLRRLGLRRRQGRHRHFRVLVASVVLMLAGAGLLAWLDDAPSAPALAATGLAALATLTLALGGWWLMRNENRALAEFGNRQPVKQRWVASMAGLRLTQGGLVSEIPWSSLRRLQRMGKAVVLHVDELHGYVIPDRAFVTEQQQLRFLRLIKANVEHHRR